ncbi:hypothetical protein K3335_003627 [Salmonella enterica]|nr:hypothetical protein [Salmonella enterica]
MNTVLTYLRTMNHPTTLDAIRKYRGDPKWRTHTYWTRASTELLFRMFTHANIEGMDVQLSFHQGQEKYMFHLFEDEFIMKRYRVDGKYADIVTPKTLGEVNQVAIITHAYTDFEELIFQESLLNDLGMFGTQEAEQLLKLRNNIFGENLDS